MELRWVERQEPAPQYGEDITMTVRVLQCRTFTAYRPLQVTPYQDITDRGPDSWSSWQDVPVVRDTQEQGK